MLSINRSMKSGTHGITPARGSCAEYATSRLDVARMIPYLRRVMKIANARYAKRVTSNQ